MGTLLSRGDIFQAIRGGNLPRVKSRLKKERAHSLPGEEPILFQNFWNENTLAHAIRYKQEDIGLYLLSQGIDPLITTSEGHSPLIFAMVNGQRRLVEAILAKIEDPTPKTTGADGYNPLEAALFLKETEWAWHLIQKGWPRSPSNPLSIALANFRLGELDEKRHTLSSLEFSDYTEYSACFLHQVFGDILRYRNDLVILKGGRENMSKLWNNFQEDYQSTLQEVTVRWEQKVNRILSEVIPVEGIQSLIRSYME